MGGRSRWTTRASLVALCAVALAPARAEAGRLVRISDLGTGAYLYEASNAVFYGTPDRTNVTAYWELEDFSGSTRIRNVATGNYLAIEHLLEWVESIPINDSWMSPRWTLQAAPTPGYWTIRNVWQPTRIVHVEQQRGWVEHGNVPTTSRSAQWLLEDAPRGAEVPWIEYEAEAGTIRGTILGPSRTFGQYAAEASGRRAVRLRKRNDHVQITATEPANSIVVRYIIPDAPGGGGMDATLSLYVNGLFRQKLILTSKYAWSYGGEASAANDPALGGAHHFYDESRALVGDIPAGATVRLQKDASDTAAWYVVDLIDLEQVAPPLTMPDGYKSIVTDCFAVPNDGLDDGDAIRTCIGAARAAQTGVWIPPGTFDSTTAGFTVSDVTIRGAGMWHSTLRGLYARFQCAGNGCRYHDFAVLGETVTRDNTTSDNAFNGTAGTGSRLENVWVEHTKVGWWVGSATPFVNPTNGLVITGCRFRNLFADGVNFCNGASNSTVANSHFRNTGDDAIASWSPSQSGGVNTNNVFHFNTVQVPWRANCYAVYGGQDNRIEDNLCFDTTTYPGILVAQQFASHPFSGVTRIQRNTLVNAGGPMWNQQHGALKIWAYDGPLDGTVLVRNVDILVATFSGLQFHGPFALTSTTLTNLNIESPGTWGIHAFSNATGGATLNGVVVRTPGSGGLSNEAGANFGITRGPGNSGW